jgi:orotate phosphoribosyltransferase
VRDLAVVHGRVTLSSGREADYYVDLRRITLSGQAASLVGVVLLDLTDDLEFDAVGGLTMGADPVATAMLTSPPPAGAGSTPSSSASRPRRTACSAASRGPTSPDRQILRCLRLAQ